MGGERKSPLRILSRFRTIRGAMIFSYMAITLVALLIFLLFSLNYTERTILENSESYTIQLVEQVNGDIDSYISYMENIMDIVTNNPELSDYLFRPDGAYHDAGTDPGAVCHAAGCPV